MTSRRDHMVAPPSEDPPAEAPESASAAGEKKKLPMLQILKDRVSKLKEDRQEYKKDYTTFEKEKVKRVSSSKKPSKGAYKAVAGHGGYDSGDLPPPPEPTVSALSSKAFPHQKSESVRRTNSFVSCLVVISVLIVPAVIFNLFEDMAVVEEDIEVLEASEPPSDGKTLADIQTELATFQAGEAEISADIETQQEGATEAGAMEGDQSPEEAPENEGDVREQMMDAKQLGEWDADVEVPLGLGPLSRGNHALTTDKTWTSGQSPLNASLRLGIVLQAAAAKDAATLRAAVSAGAVCFGSSHAWDPWVGGGGDGADAAAGAATSRHRRHRLLLQQATTPGKTAATKAGSNAPSAKGAAGAAKGEATTNSSTAPPRVDVDWFNKDVYQICQDAKAAATTEGAQSAAHSQLKACLESSQRGEPCDALSDNDKAAVRATAAALPGMQKLLDPPKCLTASGGCKWYGNKETEYQAVRNNEKVDGVDLSSIPDKDLGVKQWKSCALVGQHPSGREAAAGAMIDAHDAVWRFNLDTPDSDQDPFVGGKTSVRMLGHVAARKAADTDYTRNDWRKGEHKRWKEAVLDNGKDAVSTQDWILWNVRSNGVMDNLQEAYKPHSLRLMAADFVAWMLDTYFTLRADLEGLGMKVDGGDAGDELPCSINALPSGTHAVFLAAVACETTDVYGFAYVEEGQAAKKSSTGYEWEAVESRNWEFDRLLLRLLHLAGRISLC